MPGIEGEAHYNQRMGFHDPAEVIVIGSGLAGMSAAIQAAESRAKVTILEKEPKTGKPSCVVFCYNCILHNMSV